MSFGFGVGDFLAVGRLALDLYHRMERVPVLFDQMGKQLDSCYLLFDYLEEEAKNKTSPLNTRGRIRRDNLLRMRDNVNDTLNAINGSFDAFCNMGSWDLMKKYKLGGKPLSEWKQDLQVHIGTIGVFINTLTLSIVGQIDETTIKIYKLLLEFFQQRTERAETVRTATTAEESWPLIRLQLQSESTADLAYINQYKEQIQLLAKRAISDIECDQDELAPEDSASQQGEVSHPNGRHLSGLERHSYNSAITDSQYEEAKLLLINNGFKISTFCNERNPNFIRFSNSRFFNKSGAEAKRALLWAAYHGKLNAVRLLLQKGLPVNTQTDGIYLTQNREESYFGPKNAIQYATMKGHQDIVKLLLDNGSNMIEKTENGCDLLELAAATGHVGVIQLLCERGAAITDEDSAALLEAARGGHVEVIKKLFEFHVKFDDTNFMVMNAAAETGNGETVELLLNTQPSLLEGDGRYTNRKRPLHLACENNNLSTAKVLLDKGADMNAISSIVQSPITIAIQKKFDELLKLLLEKGASKEMVWFRVVERGTFYPWPDFEVMNSLLEHGLDIYTQNSSGFDMLRLVIRNKVLEWFGPWLVQRGLTLGGEINYGYEALRDATGALYELGVCFLLQGGVKVDASSRGELYGANWAINDLLNKYSQGENPAGH